MCEASTHALYIGVDGNCRLERNEVDPWSIVNSKPYLNYNKRPKRECEQYIPGNIAQANENFEALLLD